MNYQLVLKDGTVLNCTTNQEQQIFIQTHLMDDIFIVAESDKPAGSSWIKRENVQLLRLNDKEFNIESI
jgi:hypothetical protein